MATASSARCLLVELGCGRQAPDSHRDQRDHGGQGQRAGHVRGQPVQPATARGSWFSVGRDRSRHPGAVLRHLRHRRHQAVAQAGRRLDRLNAGGHDRIGSDQGAELRVRLGARRQVLARGSQLVSVHRAKGQRARPGRRRRRRRTAASSVHLLHREPLGEDGTGAASVRARLSRSLASASRRRPLAVPCGTPVRTAISR